MQSTVIAADSVFIANYYGNHSAKFPKFCLTSERCCQARLIASRLHLPRRTSTRGRSPLRSTLNSVKERGSHGALRSQLPVRRFILRSLATENGSRAKADQLSTFFQLPAFSLPRAKLPPRGQLLLLKLLGSPALSDERARTGKSVNGTTSWAKVEPLCFERAAQLPAERISNIRAIRSRPRFACRDLADEKLRVCK